MDNLAIFYRDCGRYAMLTREQETAVGRRIQAGDRSAVNEMVCANLRYVIRIATGFRRNHMLPMEDAIQAGAMGMLACVRRWDPERGIRFCTFATPNILRAIVNELHDTTRVVKLPRYLHSASTCDPETAAAAYALFNAPASIDFDLNETGKTIKKSLVSAEINPAEYVAEMQWHAAELEKLRVGIGRLSDRERRVLEARMNGPGLKEIAEWDGVSKERIRQIECRSLQKLAEWFGLREAAGTLTGHETKRKRSVA